MELGMFNISKTSVITINATELKSSFSYYQADEKANNF